MNIPKKHIIAALHHLRPSLTEASAIKDHHDAVTFINSLQPVETPEPIDIETAESELAIIAGELAAIQTALVSCARLMTLPPHLRDQIIISEDGDMSLMEGSHQSARDSLTRRAVNINAG